MEEQQKQDQKRSKSREVVEKIQWVLDKLGWIGLLVMAYILWKYGRTDCTFGTCNQLYSSLCGESIKEGVMKNITKISW